MLKHGQRTAHVADRMLHRSCCRLPEDSRPCQILMKPHVPWQQLKLQASQQQRTLRRRQRRRRLKLARLHVRSSVIRSSSELLQ